MSDIIQSVNDANKDKEELNEENLKKKQKENKLIVLLIIISVCTILFNTFIAQLAQVNGSSMEPTMQNGQFLVVSKISKISQDYERGDILIFNWEGRHLIKRLIGLPGETVQMKDNSIYINGEKIEDYIDVEIQDYGILAEPITLKEDEYIFLGDNRNNSIDSRTFGVVKESVIIGRVVCRILPPTKF